MRMIKLSDMFKGREKELYIILSLPSVIYLLTKRKNHVLFLFLSEIMRL